MTRGTGWWDREDARQQQVLATATPADEPDPVEASEVEVLRAELLDARHDAWRAEQRIERVRETCAVYESDDVTPARLMVEAVRADLDGGAE